MLKGQTQQSQERIDSSESLKIGFSRRMEKEKPCCEVGPLQPLASELAVVKLLKAAALAE